MHGFHAVTEALQLETVKDLQTEAFRPSNESLFKLTNALQTTLDIHAQLELFSRELAVFVVHTGVAFLPIGDNKRYVVGELDHTMFVDALRVPGERNIIGALEIGREDSVSLYESAVIRQLSENLVYPLRNAMMYQQALITASKDPLTGVNNRNMMESTIQREIDLARRHDIPLSLICADIDHFKSVNDTYGHAMGDEVLKHVVRGIQQCVRSTDVVFRYGGEEFVILLSNTGEQGGFRLAERIRQNIARTGCRYGQKTIYVTLSAGVHSLGPQDSYQDLFNLADTALYQAKNGGRNQVKVSNNNGFTAKDAKD